MSQDLPVEDLRLAIAGDPDARYRWLRLVAPTVLAWCRRLGGPSIDADDAAQDALLTAMRRLHTLREPERAWAWMYGITSRTVAWHRRRSPWRRWTTWLLEPASTRPGPDVDLATLEGAEAVERALQALPDAQREVAVLCWIEERSTAEAAQLLGVSQGTVKSRLRLARERLRDPVHPSLLPGSVP
ncbi:MAG: sigma-70 family RNA polymerase sigma factor [Myxococcales bacterium]|nr:sigma-70 family RNA polymerase sigma factor [Myxococcales bacterium]